MRILLALVVANVVVSVSDWFFFGVLWHKKYNAHPEVWRRPAGGVGEGRAVALSALVGALTPTAFILLCTSVGVVHLQQTLLLGLGVWLMGPIPMWCWSYVFMKLHPLILAAGILGWLVRLGGSALVVAVLLG